MDGIKNYNICNFFAKIPNLNVLQKNKTNQINFIRLYHPIKLGYNKYDECFNFIFYREDRNVVTNVVLNDNEKLILELLRNNNSLTASKISKMIIQSSRNIQRIMDSLRNKGLIESIGSNKNGYWKVN